MFCCTGSYICEVRAHMLISSELHRYIDGLRKTGDAPGHKPRLLLLLLLLLLLVVVVVVVVLRIRDIQKVRVC